MIADFERAEFCDRQPLGPISPNDQGRKRKRGLMVQRKEKDGFTEELHYVIKRVSRCFGDTLPSGLRPSVNQYTSRRSASPCSLEMRSPIV